MKNITLIGMPGAGKSTIGVLLAKTIGYEFIDADLVIQKREGYLLQELIDRFGIENFCKREETAICSISAQHAVIATGGSAVYGERAMRHLKQDSVVIYLKLSLFGIRRRLRNIKTRGIAMRPGQDLASLYQERKPLYEKYADITISCDRKSAEDIVAEIQKRLREIAS